MARSIVVGVSNAEDTDAALDWAAAEAAYRGCSLHLVHSLQWLLQDAFGASDEVRAGLVVDGEEILARAAARVRAVQPDAVVETSLDLDVDPATALLDRADAPDGAFMIVLGSKGRSRLGDLLAASSTLATIHDAHCPVVVVRAPVGDPVPAAPVVVGVDGSDLSARAVEAAFAEASLWGTGVRAVLTWHPPALWSPELAAYAVLGDDERQRISQASADALAGSLARWRDRYPDVPVEQVVLEGHAGEALVRASRGARLLVVGSRGRGGFAGLLLGSVSSAAIHHAECPVMVCHR